VNADYPQKPALYKSSPEEQSLSIKREAYNIVKRSNEGYYGSRLVTRRACLTIVDRSLASTDGQPFSFRRHKALTDISRYITLAQQNKSLNVKPEHTDLLPIAHPRSTREHAMTAAMVSVHRARWVTDDPEITNETVKTLIASAMTSHPASGEYEYAIARLASLPQGSIPQYALLAAFGDGNSSLARRARAMLQRRDRKGRFAEMGGGLRALIRKADGTVQSLTGRAVSQGITNDTFDMELPDGRLVRIPAKSAEGVKAILPSKDGYSKGPAKYKTGDPIIDEADLEVVDAPDGFSPDNTWAPNPDDVDVYGTKIDLGKKYTDDAYDVIKIDKPNAAAKDKFEVLQQKEAEDNNIVTMGQGKDGWLDPNKPVYFLSRRDGSDKVFAGTQSWADIQSLIKQDEPKYEKNEPADPSKPSAAPVSAPTVGKKKKATLPDADDDIDVSEPEEFDVPEGFYRVYKDESHLPQGPVDGQESSDYTDDPAALAQKFEKEELIAALSDSVKGTKDDPATGFGALEFEDGLEITPAEAIYNALKEQGEDANAILDNIYKGMAPEVSDEVKDELGGDLPDAPTPLDVSPDPDKLPPLLESLSDEEKEIYKNTGDYKQFLPKNKSYDEVPTGYAELNSDPYNDDETVLPEDAPEGFTFNPVDIANFYDKEDLKVQLRRSLEPDNAMPGYGMLSQETPEGEDYIGYVPGEALRDALQLQGEDTDSLIDEVYSEGFAGQENDAPTPQEIQDALEGEQPDTTPEEGAPSAEKAEIPAEADEGQVPPTDTAAIKVGEPDGPAKLSAKTKDLKPGDVTTNDFFTVESVEPSDDPNKSWVIGYYPGHETQKTKKWNNDTSIDVYRNVEPPQKGDLPELSKPFAKDYGKPKKNEDGVWEPINPDDKAQFKADQEQYAKDLEASKSMWTPPTDVEEWHSEAYAPDFTPSNPAGVTKVNASEVQPGDITYKKEWGKDYYEYFVVTGETTVDENGNAVVTGYYPGHQEQTKTWKGTTPISVMRGVDAPASGDKPSLERPSKDDPDFAEKKAAFDEGKKESASTFTPPFDLDSVTEPEKVNKPTYPPFMGDKLKELIAQANNDPKEFLELLNNEELIYIDFETDGADNGWDNPNPIQISMMKMKGGELIEQKTLFMNPETPLGPFYTTNKDGTPKDPSTILKDSDGNPISNEFLSAQMSKEDAFKQVAELFGPNPIIVGHNLSFDNLILKQQFDAFGVPYNPAGTIDTYPLSKKVVGGTKKGTHTLENVAKRYGLGEGAEWHDAEVDTSVLPGVLSGLLNEMGDSNSGLDALDIDATTEKFSPSEEKYQNYLAAKKKYESELAMAKTFADGMAGKQDLPTVEDLVKKISSELPSSEELSPSTSFSPLETSDGSFEVDSVLGGKISDNWVLDPENTTNIGKIPVEDWKPGDFFTGKFDNGQFFEVLEVIPDPDDEKNVFVKRRLLSNGKEYGMSKSWVKYNGYEIWRRNEAPVEVAEAPESPEPQVEAPTPTPEAEAPQAKWQNYDVLQDEDGVYYAENISASDVQGLKQGKISPPQLPFFAPLGGGTNKDTGEGYFFSANGKRFWGKYGASGAIIRRKNSDGQYEYFLAKRSSGLSQGGGKWAYPGGAHKNKEMSVNADATAKEEFLEEVGGDIANLEPISQHSSSVAPDWTYETYVYEAPAGSLGNLTPTDGENSEVGWFTAEQISKMAGEGKLQADFADTHQQIIDFAVDETPADDKPTPSDEPPTDVEVSTFFDTSNWKKIGGQEGSNQGAFYVDPDTGDEYYVKVAKSDKHAANEVLASALYEEAGVKVGRSYLGKDKNDKTVIVSPIIQGSEKNFKSARKDPETLKNAQADFAVDAWLNNYDAVGQEYDNMLTVDKDVYRIDAGGALIFRAQGLDKDLPDTVTQIDDMRNPSKNKQGAEVFGSMTDEEIAESAKKVQAISPERIDEIVDAAFADDPETGDFIKEQLKKRRQDLIDRFNLEETAPEEVTPEPVQSVSSEDSIVAFFPFGDYESTLKEVIAKNKKIGFTYTNAKGYTSVKVVTPAKDDEGNPIIETNKNTGKTNLKAIDSDGKIKNFTISQMGELPEDYTPEISKPAEVKEVDETPDAEITPSANDNITPVGPDPEPEVLETPATPADKPTEVPQAEKAKLIEDLSSIAEQIFGKAPDKESLKNLLNSLKDQGGNSDIIDSVIADLDAPEPKELETPEEKAAEDIVQSMIPEDPTEKSLTPEDIESILSNPDETNPELIWKAVKDNYNGTVLDSGHIVVNSVKHGDVQYDVVVRRNADNSFSVYHRITNPDGTSKVYSLKKKNHSSKALNNSIASQIYNSTYKPSAVKSKSKSETADTLLPTSVGQVPTEKESFVAADGTVLKVGDTVEIVNPTHSKFGQKATVLTTKRTFSSKGYGYTDYLKVKYEDGEKNQIVSKSVKPDGSGWKWGDPKKVVSTPESTPTTSPSPTPSPEPTPAGEAPEVELPKVEAPSLGEAKSLAEVETLAAAKNSDTHIGYYGAANYSDYKEFLKGGFLKDPESKNMVPGIIVGNASPNSSDPELTSYGVITNMNGAKNGEVEVSYFDGPLAGQSATLTNDKVWSREKFLTIEQAKELDIDISPAYRDSALGAAKAKGEKYKKELEAKALKAKQDAEAKALKSQFEVNGPGFALTTADKNAPADWTTSPVENAPSLQSALKLVKGDDVLQAAKGATVLTDSDSMEDLEMRVQKVTGKGGKEQIRVTFTLTDWAANPRVAEMIDDDNVTKSDGLKIDKWEKQPDGSLKYSKIWEKSSVDQYGNGVTYSGKAGKGIFKIHRAQKGADKADFFKHAGSSNYSVSFHNKVEILLPATATEKDIADAVKQMGGVDSVRPATKADIKGLVENKMIWLYGRNTDGTKNYSGELRQKVLDQIKADYGFTADDVEVSVDVDARGRINYLVPQSVADKIAADSGVNYFYHNWMSSTPSGTQEYANWLFGIFQSGSLYSTTNRWMDGINVEGMSSKADVKANGGNYMFTHPSTSKKNSSSNLVFTFDAKKLLRRMDFYKNNSDKYGQLMSDQEDVVSKLSSGGGEIMWKKNLSWSDLAHVSLPPEVRKALIKKLTESGLPEYAKILEDK
jgi:DNA polymerase III epsilon subunit-like protein